MRFAPHGSPLISRSAQARCRCSANLRDKRFQTIRTSRDWILRTVGNIQATLETYALERFGLLVRLRWDEPGMAALIEQIAGVYGVPPK